MTFSPTKVGELRGVDPSTLQDVPKCMKGSRRAWGAGSLACIVVPPLLQPLKESAASCGTVPKDPLDAGEGGGLQAVLV